MKWLQHQRAAEKCPATVILQCQRPVRDDIVTGYVSPPVPDPLQTAAFDVFSGFQGITIMGLMLTAGIALVMAGVWVAMRIAGKRLKTAGIVEEKIVVHYIETGEVSGACTRPPARPPPKQRQQRWGVNKQG